MQTFLLILNIVSQLLPSVVAIVKQVEIAFPNTPGAAKLNVVQASVESAFHELGSVGVSFSQVWPSISAFVAATVTLYNASGLFKKSAQAVNTVASTVQQTGAAIVEISTVAHANG